MKFENKTIVVSGGATGIGAALKQILVDAGAKVLVIDIKDADVVADLSKDEGCAFAIDEITRLAPEGVHGFVPCAGLGPQTPSLPMIIKVNLVAAIQLTEGLKPLLEKVRGCVVAVSSNSAVLPGLDKEFVKSLLSAEYEKSFQQLESLDGHNAYAGSKYALACWVRAHAPEYIAKGVRINAVAPGITKTPLTDKVFEDKTYGEAMKDFADMTPFGEMASPDMIAESISFLLSEKAKYIVGSILFVDGGADALLRPRKF